MESNKTLKTNFDSFEECTNLLMIKIKKPQLMNSKISVFFVMTLAVILSASLITTEGIQQTVADRNNDNHDRKM